MRPLGRDYSIGGRLSLMVIAVMAPFVLFTGALILRHAKTEQARMEDTLTAQVRGLAADIDREVADAQRAAILLATTSRSLRAGNFKDFYSQARNAITIEGLQIVLADPSGQELVNTGKEFGAPLGKMQRATEVAAILAAGKPHISALITGTTPKRPIIAVDIPVKDAAGGPYLLTWALDAERLQHVMRDQQLPASELAGVIDTQGILIARIPQPEQFVGRRASPAFLTGATGAAGSFRTALGGTEVFNSYVRSPSTGWLVSVAIPEPILLAPMRRSLLLIAGGGLGVLLLAALGSVLVARRIAAPIEALSKSALAIGRGEQPSMPSSGIREVTSVSASLQTAYELLQQNEKARSAAESELRSLAAIVASSDDAIVSISLSGIVTSWNKAAERIFGYTAAEMMGHSVLSLAVPGHDDDTLSILDRIKRGERTEHYETIRRNKYGETLHVSLSVSPIYDAGGQLVGASEVARDITAAKRAEAALKQSEAALQELHAELLHVSRLSSMGQMAAMVAHELNQPLTAISNYMEAANALLGRGGDPPLERIRGVLVRAADQAVRAGQIIERLRGFASRGDGERRIEAITPLMNEAAELALVGTKLRGISITVRDRSEGAAVLVNKVEIQQVLLNLLRNSAEAVADQEERREIVLSAEKSNGKVLIKVIDNGPGLAEEVRAKLFQPFVSTKRTGMGLGLSICHAIVAAYEGELWAEPNPEGGTIFCMSLATEPAEELV